jgi:hypothetical protein
MNTKQGGRGYQQHLAGIAPSGSISIDVEERRGFPLLLVFIRVDSWFNRIAPG